jgi:FkbM family methyltransferase
MIRRYLGSALFPLDSIYRVTTPLINQSLVFDIGANRGAMTRIFTDAGAFTVAVEPQSFLVRDNPGNFKDCAAIEFCCVAADNGRIPFYPSVRDTISSCNPEWRDGYFKDDPESESLPPQTIETVTLEMLIEKYGRPKYIKIDVEGFEDQVLAGLKSTVDMLSFEYTGGYPEVFESCAQEMQRLNYHRIIAFEEKKKGAEKLCRIFEFDGIDKTLSYFRALDKYRQGDLLLLNRDVDIDLGLLDPSRYES